MQLKTEVTCINRSIKSDICQITVYRLFFIRIKTSIIHIKSFKRIFNTNIALGNKTKRHTRNISISKTTRLKVYVAIKVDKRYRLVIRVNYIREI